MEIQNIKFGEKISKGIINRSVIIILLLLLQFVLLAISFFMLTQYIHYIYIINLIMSFVLVVFIVNRKGCPEFKIAWLTFMCLLPVFGILYYLFIELNPKLKRNVANVKSIIDDSAYLLDLNQATLDKIAECVPEHVGLLNYLQKKGPYPVYDNTDVEYYNDGEKAFDAMKTALRNAKTYIFMEYFVVAPGKLLDELIEILNERAEAGVEIRFMYDGLCHAKTLAYDFPLQMKKLGIDVNVFEPFSPFLSSDQNNRDHRKITVVDGEFAFTGGFNLADEYVNFTQPYGHWKDVAVKISGDAVKTFVVLFLQNWHLNGSKKKDVWKDHINTDLRNSKVEQNVCNGGFVTPYADSPNINNEIGETVYLDIINQAKNYVWIMTPYLILGSDVLKAITYATGRGIDVRIIIPHIPDKKIPFLIAKSFYPELIQAGIKIFEYTPGFAHGKIFISDDSIATIGSYNLDYRSFYLNYEVGAWLVNCPAIKDIKHDYMDTLQECKEITMLDYKALPFLSRIMGKAFRIFGPLM